MHHNLSSFEARVRSQTLTGSYDAPQTHPHLLVDWVEEYPLPILIPPHCILDIPLTAFGTSTSGPVFK